MPQLYARVFVQILESSIADNWKGRYVFEDMLKLADDGILDMTKEAFARRTNVPLDVVTEAIQFLESPDQRSRDKESDGRRIVRLDEHRDWGWRIVNWHKYDAVRTRADATERQRRYRDKSLPSTPPLPLSIPDKDPDSDSGALYDKTISHNQASHFIDKQADEVYKEYPRKIAKVPAIKSIRKAIAKHGYDHVLARTKEYALSRVGQDQQFTPYPSTWFNQERYNDDPSTWVIDKKIDKPVKEPGTYQEDIKPRLLFRDITHPNEKPTT